MADVSDLLAAYDEQARARVPDPLPRGVTVERDGPLLRFFGIAGRGFVVYRDLGGLEGAELDELIARQVEVFAARSERFEWKLHEHDLPSDLSRRRRKTSGPTASRSPRSTASRPTRSRSTRRQS